MGTYYINVNPKCAPGKGQCSPGVGMDASRCVLTCVLVVSTPRGINDYSCESTSV